MRIRQLIEEDFVNYKYPSMFIGTCFCTWKCCVDGNFDKKICQNYKLLNSSIINIKNSDLYNRYVKNPITKSIVIGGLEPLLQIEDVYELIKYFRTQNIKDDFVLYTGYNIEEVCEDPTFKKIKEFGNIIVKFGRYIPDSESKFDNVLGVTLASKNQYALKF